MTEEAEAAGANAIVNVHFTTSSIIESAVELNAYGTAVAVI